MTLQSLNLNKVETVLINCRPTDPCDRPPAGWCRPIWPCFNDVTVFAGRSRYRGDYSAVTDRNEKPCPCCTKPERSYRCKRLIDNVGELIWCVCVCVSDEGFGGGEAAGGGSVGGPVSPDEELPGGACHAHTDPGSDRMLHSQTTGPRGLPGNPPDDCSSILLLTRRHWVLIMIVSFGLSPSRRSSC